MGAYGFCFYIIFVRCFSVDCSPCTNLLTITNYQHFITRSVFRPAEGVDLLVRIANTADLLLLGPPHC